MITETYQKDYRQTEKYKISRKRYQQSKKGKATLKRYQRCSQQLYQQSEKYKISKKLYRQSERGKALRKIARKSCDKKYVMGHPKQIKAIYKVNRAVTCGEMSRPDKLQCTYCPVQAEHYHHYKGYEPKHWLDVIPLCRKCHRKIHKKSA